MILSDVIELNPRLSLKKGSLAPFIEMAALPILGKHIPEIGERDSIGSGAKFQNGDTLVARITPCLENGKGGYVSGLPHGAIGQGSTEFIVFRAKHPDDEQFAYYLSRLPEFRSFAERGMEGTSGRQRVTWQTLADFEIFPLSATQRRELGEILSALDDKIELNRQMNETLEAMARAVFVDWFVDFGPTRRQMAGETDPVKIMGNAFPAAKAQTLAPLFPATLNEAGLPEGWRLGRLDDWASVVTKTTKPNEVDQNTHYIGLEHMPRRSIALSQWETAAKVTSNKSAFERGQILFGKLRPYFHKVGIAPFDGICSTDIIVVDGLNPELRAFVATIVSTDDFVSYTNQSSSGTKMPRTSWKLMREYPLARADKELVFAFSQLIQPMHDKVLQSLIENQSLAEMRDLLLPKLMYGEISLKAAAHG